MHQIVASLQSLPAMPETARKILSIELASDRGNELLLRLIEKDLAISARVIGLANSPLFGSSRKIMTIGEAAIVLGIKRVKMVALGFAMMSSMTRNPRGLLNRPQLWQHSMAVALAMDALSAAMPLKMRPPNDEIYLAGLLHDIGFLVLEYVDPELSNRFHESLANADSGQDSELEAQLLETNHCELGALLAEQWNLTGSIIAVLRYHHSEGGAKNLSAHTLIAMTNLAEKLLPTFGLNETDSSEISAAEWHSLGIIEAQIEPVEALMRQRAKEISSAIL